MNNLLPLPKAVFPCRRPCRNGFLAILLALLGNSPAWSALDYASCELIREMFAKSMASPALFEEKGGQCQEVVPEKSGNYFVDPGCTHAVSFKKVSFQDFCRDNLLGNERSKNYIGNPKKWKHLDRAASRRETKWSLSQGVRLHLSAVDQTVDKLRPFVKQVEYRTVGECSLGMHVYKQDLRGSELKPLLFFHGGGWTHRGAAAIAAIESSVPHFTSRGYIVFAPFHRLMDDVDGPEACQGAQGSDLIADLEAAKEWVFTHGQDYGMGPQYARERKLSVMGQSSGAQFAAYLAVQFPQEIERGLLLYPPGDFGFFIENLQAGGLYVGRFQKEQELLVQFVNQEGVSAAKDIALDHPLVLANSLPGRLRTLAKDAPALFLLQGDADQTIPVEMSLRLCAALAGEELSGRAYRGGSLERPCGERSQLHIIAGADHILDLRCFLGEYQVLAEQLLPETDGLCPAGSPDGEEQVRRALSAAYAWFDQREIVPEAGAGDARPPTPE